MRDFYVCEYLQDFSFICRYFIASDGTIAICEVDGTIFREGEKFSPHNTCLQCVCQKGFNGTFDKPFCKRKTCGEQLTKTKAANLENYCAPVYYTKDENVLCCPDSYICRE